MKDQKCKKRAIHGRAATCRSIHFKHRSKIGSQQLKRFHLDACWIVSAAGVNVDRKSVPNVCERQCCVSSKLAVLQMQYSCMPNRRHPKFDRQHFRRLFCSGLGGVTRTCHDIKGQGGVVWTVQEKCSKELSTTLGDFGLRGGIRNGKGSWQIERTRASDRLVFNIEFQK